MDKTRALRAGGGILGAGIIGTFGRQLVIGPTQEAIEAVGFLVEPQSVYVGAIIVGTGLFLVCSWSGAVWVYNIPGRYRQRRRQRRQQQVLHLCNQTNETQSLILRLSQVGVAFHLERLDTPDELGHHEGTQLGADLAITLRRLGELGFARPDGVSGEDWLAMLNQVYKYLEKYGIGTARSVMTQLIEDHRTGTVRSISHEFRLSSNDNRGILQMAGQFFCRKFRI